MTRALLIADGEVRYKKLSVFAPFEQFAAAIASELDLSWELVWLDPAAPALPPTVSAADFDCAFVQDLALARLPALDDLDLPRIFVDTGDSTMINHAETLATYAARLKGQLLRDRDDYRADGHNTRWFERALSELYGLAPPTSPPRPLDPALDPRLVLGWNCGVLEQTRSLLAWTDVGDARPIDICFRGKVLQPRAPWYERHRRDVVDRLTALATTCTVLAETTKLPIHDYVDELRHSKVCVSPFGWGEVCIRDFEAVAAGCLLVKPDMSRIETEPDIFVAHDTYVPFALDGSDLAEVCRHYLARPGECARIARNARAAYAGYFDDQRYLDPIREALARV